MTGKATNPTVGSDETLRLFLNRIAGVRGEIRHLILFGSRARGDARSDSDYDLLVVVAKRTNALLDALYDAVMETLLVSGRLVSLKIFVGSEYERLNKLSTPFMRRVREQGVPLG